MNFLANVRVRRSGAWIRARHSPVADRRKQHSNHRDQNGGYNVAAGFVADYSKNPHRSNWLDDDNSNDDQVSEPQRSLQMSPSVRCECRSFANHNCPDCTRMQEETK